MSTVFHERVRGLLEQAASRPTRGRTGFVRAAAVSTAVRAEALRLLPAFNALGPTVEAASDLLPAPRDLAAWAGRGSPWQPPFCLAPYTVVELLGAGGMGVVYRAVHPVQNVSVAIKLLRAPLYSPAACRQFKHEEELLRQLRHPGIVRLLHGGLTDSQSCDAVGRPLGEQPYLVMEYVEGAPLRALLGSAELDVFDRVAILEAICRAVEYAHRRDVIHCDLKPGNVIVRPDGDIVVLDFGISRLQALDAGASGRAVGATPAYASPEQLSGRPLTPESDVYSIGRMACELLRGRLPTPAGLDFSCVCPPAGSGYTREDESELRCALYEIVATALRRQQRRRYPHAGALADAFARVHARFPRRRGWRAIGHRLRRFATGSTSGEDRKRSLLAAMCRQRLGMALDHNRRGHPRS